MRAIQVTRLDGPAAVEEGEVDAPVAGGRVLIDVHAAGVTYPDVLLTRGEYQMKPHPPFVPGSEVAGVVREAPGGSGLAVGDRVAALCGIGGFAEVAAAGVDSVFPLPDALSFVEGAAVPVNHLTAELALGRRGQVQAGETVLVHGAAGGVGSSTVQLAKALGARVIAVTSSDEKAELARRLGADETIRPEGFKDVARELTDGRGVDVVVDPVGGDRFTDSLRSLAREGRVLVLGFVGGEIPTVKVNRLLLANTSVVGVAWGELVMATPGLLQEQWAGLLPHLSSGALSPAIGATHDLADAAVALTRLDERRALGNVVLTVARDSTSAPLPGQVLPSVRTMARSPAGRTTCGSENASERWSTPTPPPSARRTTSSWSTPSGARTGCRPGSRTCGTRPPTPAPSPCVPAGLAPPPRRPARPPRCPDRRQALHPHLLHLVVARAARRVHHHHGQGPRRRAHVGPPGAAPPARHPPPHRPAPRRLPGARGGAGAAAVHHRRLGDHPGHEHAAHLGHRRQHARRRPRALRPPPA